MKDESVIKLNVRQKLFCELYIKKHKLNATQAAIEAGYSRKGANVVSSKLLAKDNIKAYVAIIKADLAFLIDVDARRIAEEYKKIAFFNIKEIYNVDGGMKQIQDISDDTASAIISIESLDQLGPAGENYGTLKKIKLNDKIQSLDKLAKMLGLDGVSKTAITDAAGNDVFQLIFQKDTGCEPIKKNEENS